MNNLWLEDHPVWCIGHRGSPCQALENTLESFQAAIRQNVDGIELDVHLSADKIAFVIHDDIVHFGGKNTPISRLASGQLDGVRLLSGGQNYRIARLSNVLDLVEPGRILINIELKPTIRPQDASLIISLVETKGLLRRTIFSSFSLPLLKAIKQYSQDCATGYLYGHSSKPRPYPGVRYNLTDIDALHPHYSLVDDHYSDWAESLGKNVHVWTVNNAAWIEKLRQQNIQAIISDRPDYWQR